MASLKLSAPVGLSPRESEGTPVKNKSGDVLLVRKMLVANGIGPLKENTSVDAGLIKAITAYQKKIGMKTPDGVIDPAETAFKALLPKYHKQLREEANTPMTEVKFRGKTLRLTANDQAKLAKQVFSELDRYLKSLITNHTTSLKIYEEYLSIGTLKAGALKAVSLVVVMNWTIKIPDAKYATRSMSAVSLLKRAMSAKDLNLLHTALPAAEKSVNEFNFVVGKFLKELGHTAQIQYQVCRSRQPLVGRLWGHWQRQLS